MSGYRTAAPYLRHVTLTTGHMRDSYRSEVADDVVAVCRQLLDRAIAGEDDDLRVPIPGMAGCEMAVISTTRSLLCTIWYEGERIAQVGIATHSRAGASLWRVLTEVGAQTPIKVEQCPPEPWIAARLEPGIANCPRELVIALGDFERCTGWAFIERAEAQH